ncbi:MAG: hypothetical protein CMH81_00935 [Nitrospiraceae bacterium]|nr:hypothetical protein [Nitrospiraceae bacterium]|tara:strand:- start:3103 stop:3831 length:729 start_codon:yes stop_codon:yes gene_type:complete
MRVLPGLTLDLYPTKQDEIDFWNKNGYLLIEELFSQTECQSINDIHRAHADKDFKGLINLDREVEEIRSLMKAPKVVSIMRALKGGREIVGLMTQIMFKEAGSPHSFGWSPHQDNAYPQSENGEYFTINIPLVNQDRENGCMYIYPGSHKEGTFPFAPTPSYEAGKNPGNTIPDEIIKRYTRVDLLMKRGSALFLHGDVIHGSYNNPSDRSRPMFSMCYIPKGVTFIPGNTAKRMEISLTQD